MSNTVQTIQAPTTTGNTFGLMATPALDLTHTGRLPYVVDQPDIAREHTEPAAPIAAPIRAVAEQIIAQCCQRRPDRDPSTGDLLSGVEDTDDTFRDRLLCVERHGHDGDHRDFMRRTWPHTVQAAEQPRDRAEQIERLIAALPDAVDESMREAIPHRYSPEVAAAITQTMTGILTGALCPVWPTVCTDTAPGHYDHHNHEHKVTDKRGEELFHVGFVQFSDTTGEGAAVICIGSEDYDPSEVRAKTAELRRLLDQADDMADKVMRMQGTDVQPPAERAFSAALASIDAAFKASQDIGRTRDALRTFVDMTAAEVRA